MKRTDAVTVEWYPEFRNGAAVPKAVTMTIGDHRFVPLDPEDREMVERLVRACPTDWGFEQDEEMLRECTGEMQSALRSLLEPPKPDEPTGLGAVVLDAEGGAWVNSHPRDKYPWVRNADDGSGYESCQYADIAAVRVLSEGVCDV